MVVKNLGLHSALPCVILGPFNISCVFEVAGQVLASSLLEASSFAGVVGSDVATSAGAVSTSSARSWRARGACDLAVSKTQFFQGLLAVMQQEQRLLGVDGGRLAPCRVRLGRRSQFDCHIR